MNHNVSSIKDKEAIFQQAKQYEAAFLHLVHDRLGIVMHHHQLHHLYNVIESACIKYQCTPKKYLDLLNQCTDQSPLLEHLVSGVTIGETYFFRDRNQMNYLKNELLPSLINEKRKQHNLCIRIWSAGCATGEEIYTIAIMLNELMPDIKKWNINLLGTDINNLALKKALLGKYSDWALRSLSEQDRKKYFIKENRHYTLLHSIRSLVKFDYLNLNDSNYPSICNNTNSHDLILCRNVLIYFDNEVVQRLMNKLSASLAPGGFLMLGASDPIELKKTDLRFYPTKILILRKPTEEEILTKKAVPAFINENKKPLPSHAIANRIHTTSQPKRMETYKVPVNDQTIKSLLDNSQWAELLALVNQLKAGNKILSPTAFHAKAIALANMGHLNEATHLMQKYLSDNATDKHAYLLYALTLIEMNQLREAEIALRNALFLDRGFVMCHYQLGLLLIRQKQMTSGLKCLENALSIAESKQPDQTVSDAKGLTYGRLAEILRKELDLYTEGIPNNG